MTDQWDSHDAAINDSLLTL